MRQTTHHLVLFLTIVSSSFLISHSSICYADSARSSSITDWGDCGGGSRSWWDDMCMRWRQTMGARGWGQWKANYELVTIDRYIDPSSATWGHDNANLDGGDAALMCTHGGWDTNGWYGLMHHKVQNDCNLNASQMLIGSASGYGKLRFFQLSSCNSIRWPYRGAWFHAATGGVHVITGFHGYMYIGSRYVDEYGNQANKGFQKGVAMAWMEEMYHESHWYNGWNNLCPMAIGFGDSPSAAISRLNERYNSHWPNLSPFWMATTYYKGCSPDGADPLPN